MLFGATLLWLPAIDSASLIILLDGGIAAQPRTVPLLFAAALLAQFSCAVYSGGWVAGIPLQAVLALSLRVRMKLQR
ncbi:MAG TPA: hypothetical protein VGC55_15700 [Dokdonella sp.]